MNAKPIKPAAPHAHYLKERGAFDRFVQLSGLPVLASSIEERYPPEPDLLCELIAGGFRAFEVVEICHEQNASFPARDRVIQAHLEEARRKLPPHEQAALLARFRDHWLVIECGRGAKLQDIREALPTVLADLVKLPLVDNSLSGFSTEQAQATILRVRLVTYPGPVPEPGEVNFKVGEYFDLSEVLSATISAKLKKRYVTDHPIELLAFRGDFSWPSGDPMSVVADVVARMGMGPFQRIWLLEHDAVLTYPR